VSQIRSFCKCGHARLDHQVEWHDGGNMPCLQCECPDFEPEDEEKESCMNRDDLGDLGTTCRGIAQHSFLYDSAPSQNVQPTRAQDRVVRLV
jgi:hypothetical protein